MATRLTFIAEVTGALKSFADKAVATGPDNKHNAGRFYCEVLCWDIIAKLSKNMREGLWDKLLEANFIDKNKLEEGKHELLESPHLIVSATTSRPYPKFDKEKLARDMAKKFKCPIAVANELIAAAHVDGDRRSTFIITER